MRVGLLYQRIGSSDDLAPMIEQIMQADRLGFDSVWIEDRHFDDHTIGSAVIVLAALAKRTRAIHLGTFRILALEHPVRTAEDFAMIDLLSNGRLNFGAAVGSEPEPFRTFRVPFAERAGRFSEALDIVLAAWTFDEFAYGGQHYQFPSHAAPGTGLRRHIRGHSPYVPQWERGPEQPDFLTITPKPLQQPRPSVWILADQAESVNAAAEQGHSLILPHVELAELEATAAAYEMALRRARRGRSEVELAIITDVPLDGRRVAAGTLEQLHRLQDATGANQIIWRIDPQTDHQSLLGALKHFASEVQPLLQA